MSDQIGENKRRSVALLAAFVVLLTTVVWLIGALLGVGLVALAAGLVVAGLLAGAALRRSAQVALTMSRATAADAHQYARFHNLVEGLCVAAGLPKPALYVVDDAGAAAFAVGRDPRHAAIVATTGLLENLSRIELEGVIAHELSHIKSYDIRVATLAVTVLALPLQFFRPLLSKALSLTLNQRREMAADVTGVALTRYPPGLISALEKLRDRAVAGAAPLATAHLWCTTYTPLEERIQALREL